MQKAISLSKNNTLEVINTDNLGNEFRYDDCHFNEIELKRSLEISNIIRSQFPMSKILPLQSLRGICVLVVMLVHFNPYKEYFSY